MSLRQQHLVSLSRRQLRHSMKRFDPKGMTSQRKQAVYSMRGHAKHERPLYYISSRARSRSLTQLLAYSSGHWHPYFNLLSPIGEIRQFASRILRVQQSPVLY
eukprot:Blabericola_migrator_1__7012@NODE_3555_length_1681_cov_5_014250_g2208_i0_p2_GENE_NODE_3555_length_1681_cov_5_014250_g2208_i0NODE_3555_length_1681_cov_5_014250_g2208_i0_p2_ORF_typecomplete_len103_score3_21CLTH/PF10607_9/0_032_NODE_3555_length_1681_cov_5_014250_g2208_i011991507